MTTHPMVQCNLTIGLQVMSCCVLFEGRCLGSCLFCFEGYSKNLATVLRILLCAAASPEPSHSLLPTSCACQYESSQACDWTVFLIRLCDVLNNRAHVVCEHADHRARRVGARPPGVLQQHLLGHSMAMPPLAPTHSTPTSLWQNLRQQLQ